VATSLPTDPARTELVALAARGVTWNGWPSAAEAARPAAVLILFGRLDDVPSEHSAPAVHSGVDVLLVARAASLSHHPGQVSFPGGRIDPGDSGPVDAALREAVEETGLDPAGVEVLGTLRELPVPVSDHRVTPVLAWWTSPSAVAVVDAAESAHVFRAPVADLLDPENRRTVVVARERAPRAAVHRSPGFLVDGHVVWGFTAMVLDRLFDELGWTEDWDRSRTIEPPR
jgi:8-oxo-dGTP pyrophosphatase MutT (NUDIX family)